MNPLIKKIIQNAVFNDNVLAETITYNGVEILAIVEIGENEAQQSPGFMRHYKAVVVQGNGYFTVSVDDVPEPKRGDLIVYDGKKYYVAGIELHDSAGGQFTLKVTADSKGYLNL